MTTRKQRQNIWQLAHVRRAVRTTNVPARLKLQLPTSENPTITNLYFSLK